ncbi:MAG: hypothetical protein P4L10_14985 [Acidobacteriaceae bacterium]|nr:hypothetical protein [Acidobacteriaceae bacterium]
MITTNTNRDTLTFYIYVRSKGIARQFTLPGLGKFSKELLRPFSAPTGATIEGVIISILRLEQSK